MKKYIKERVRHRKATINAQGKDISDHIKPSFDVPDPKFSKTNLGFPPTYGDESHYDFWKHKAVDLNVLLFGKSEEPITA